MWLHHLRRVLGHGFSRNAARLSVQRRLVQPRVERLEERTTPATITVTTISDAASHSGISLRDAIATANNDAKTQSDTINFDPTLNGKTITLGQGVLELNGNASGVITITGAGQITVSGGGSSEVFKVDSGTTAVFQGLTITGGQVNAPANTTASGGGILNAGTLSVYSCTVTGNTVTATGVNGVAQGGGIFSSGTLTVGNSTVSNNTALAAGSGVYSSGSGASLTIFGSTFTGNNNEAIRSNGTTAKITGCTITGNTGHAVVCSNPANAPGTTTVSDSTISNNTGTGVFCGGGINGSALATITNCLIANNTTTISNGSQATAAGVIDNASVTLINSTITGNTVHYTSSFGTAEGGGIFNGDVCTLRILGCTISNNSIIAASGASGQGAGIYNYGQMTVYGSTISNNTLSGSSDKGGGIYQEVFNGGYANTISDTTITGNSAANGGGLYTAQPVTLSNVTIANNTATSTGGGIFDASAVTMYNTLVANNNAATSPDIALNTSGSPTLTGNNDLVANGSGIASTPIKDGVNGNIVGHATNLGTLQWFGGPTQTIALQSTSPAIGAGGGLTTLTTSGGINATATSFTVGDAVSIASTSGSFPIQIDNEIMTVTSVNTSTKTLTVTRGTNGTTAASHNQNAAVFLAFDQAGTARVSSGATDIGASNYTITSTPTVSIIQNYQQPETTTTSSSATFQFSGYDTVTPVNQLVFMVSLDGSTFTTATSPVTYTNLAPGSHTFQVEAVNQNSVTSTPASYTWTASATVTASITSQPAPVTASTSANFVFTGTSTITPTNQLIFMVNLDNAGFATASSPQSYTNLQAGVHTFKVEAIDQAGDVSQPVTYSWNIDLTPPTASITQKPPSFANSASATFTFTGSDNVTPAANLTFMTKLDAGAFASDTSPHAYTNLAQGSHTFTVEAIDQVGNVSQPVSYTWTVDTTAPTVSITQQPAAFTSSTSATFAFTGSDNITTLNNLVFKTNLDGAGFVNSSSPKTYNNLLAGNHTFQVEDIDQAGNVSTFATVMWTIDNQPPTVQITQSPPAISNSTAANFTYTGSDDVTPAANLVFKVSLDGSTFTTQASPAAYTGLAAGSHNFQVEAIDQAGNVSTPASYNWTVDTTAPTATITQSPPQFSNSTAASFTFTGSDNVTPTAQLTFNTKLDGGSFTTSTSPASLTNLSAGSHTFQVEAIDQAGNVSTVISYTWTVDTAAPTASLTQSPPQSSNSTTASFTFTGSDNVTPANQLTFLGNLDSAGFTTVTSPASFSNLTGGSHTFQLEAIDQAGNVSTAVSYTWTVDTTAPTVSITQQPPALTSSTTASFTFTGSDNVTPTAQLVFKTSLDNAPFAVATSPQTLNNLAGGNHTFQVESIDQAGNVSTVTSVSWTVDATPPTVALTQQPPAFTSSSSASFTFTGSDNLTPANQLVFKVSLDNSAFTTATSPASYTNLTAGNHTFQIEDIDQAGNVSTVASSSWTIDTTAPTASITQQPPALTNSTSASFSFTGSDNVTPAAQLVFQTSLDNAAFATATSPATYTNLTTGSHTFQVKATDQAGNVSTAASYSWTIDTTAPTVSITQQPPALAATASATFAFSGTDNLTPANQLVFKASLDNGAFATATSPASYTQLADGSHTFQVESLDQAGNLSAVSSYTWTVDTTSPTVTITQQPAAFTSSTSATFAFTGSDNLTPVNQLVFKTSLDNAAFATATSPVALTNLTAGSHTFKVEAIDLAGNVSTVVSSSWTIDTTAPTVSITQQPAALTNSASATFAFTGSDNVTPANQLVFKTSLDSAGFAVATSPVNISSLADGQHTFQVESIDQAGNVSTAASATWTIDTKAPTSSVTALPGTEATTAFTVSWSGSDGNGSGIASYTVSVSDNGGTFTPLVTNTTQTSAQFTGQNGHTYSFYSVATDRAGNVQPTPSGAQASTRIILTTATKLVITAQPPGSIPLNNGFGFTVTAENIVGNVDPNFSGTVTVSLANNPGNATLSGGAVMLQASQGVAAFSGLTLNQVANGYTLQVTSNGLTPTTTASINVTGITSVTMSPGSVLEFRPVGTAVGTFSSSEAGSGHAFTYLLVNGAGATDNGSFAISGNQLLTADAFDSAAKSSYSLRVRSTDETSGFAEQTFTITVTADPALKRTGRTLAVSGLQGNDTFTFVPGAVRHALTLDGVKLAVDTASVDSVTFTGGSGSSTATLTGGSSTNTLNLAPNSGTLSGSGYSVSVDKVSTVVGMGNLGDTASLHDSSAVINTLTSTTANTYLSGTGYFSEAVGFGTVVAFANSGDNATAYIYDSAGNDSFTATTQAGYLISSGQFREAVGFNVVAAIASLGGQDSAVFFDGAGSNTFVGTPTQAYLYGGGYFNEAIGFKTVVASEVHGNSNSAQLFDTGGSNTFIGTPTYAYLLAGNGTFFNEAAGFQSAVGFAGSGSNDSAQFFDSGNTNSFIGTQGYAYLLGANFLNEVVGFKAVATYAGPGSNDSAQLFASGSGDSFIGSPTYSTLTSNGTTYALVGFLNVAVSESAPGTGSGATLFDSAGNDTFTGQGSSAVQSGPGYTLSLSGFKSVVISSTHGGFDAKHLLAVDYVFAALGNWQ